uniref:Uncharacterized protein ycf23 n=1 Tax=Lympha mucosa TaxID=2045360 RepID=A0A6B9VS57_9FLOR|nr:hypothetical protein [Lympha mucosa]
MIDIIDRKSDFSENIIIMIVNKKLKNVLNRHEVLKIIIGINNFNLNDIIARAKEAEIGGATYIDIAANINILYELKQVSSLPICVSSINSHELFICFKAGADILEVGNFDIFYKRGIILSSKEIIAIAKDIMNRAPLACVCVTIPHYLSLLEQIQLAKKLESLGVDIIQTEGFSSKSKEDGCLVNSLNKASNALSSTYVFAKYLKVPIISASGINSLSAPIAVFYGASGIGVGSFVSHLNDSIHRSLIIQYISKSISKNFITDISNNNLNLYPVFDSININQY